VFSFLFLTCEKIFLLQERNGLRQLLADAALLECFTTHKLTAQNVILDLFY